MSAEPEPPVPPAAPVTPPALAFPLGHFYSPVPDTAELARPRVTQRVWPLQPREHPGLDWREPQQLELLAQLARQPPLELPRTSSDPQAYRLENEMFNGLDAWLLQGLLRAFRPRRVVEVGCGFSSLLTAQVNREFLDGDADVTCIEPYPPDFLRDGVPGLDRVVAKPVQDAGLEVYADLDAGDVLFIDTSHTVKTGNDVLWLTREVLPGLRPGVLVHFHDIFLPHDYPRQWVMDGRGWNEQYLLEAFLAYNSSFEILLAANWLHFHHADALTAAAGGLAAHGGGSPGLRRLA